MPSEISGSQRASFSNTGMFLPRCCAMVTEALLDARLPGQHICRQASLRRGISHFVPMATLQGEEKLAVMSTHLQRERRDRSPP
jgi:hypothetical protein